MDMLLKLTVKEYTFVREYKNYWEQLFKELGVVYPPRSLLEGLQKMGSRTIVHTMAWAQMRSYYIAILESEAKRVEHRKYVESLIHCHKTIPI